MNNLYTAVTKKDGNWWTGWVIEIPGVNCQERTHKKLLESLKITLKEALEFNIFVIIVAHFQEKAEIILTLTLRGEKDGFDESNPYTKK